MPGSRMGTSARSTESWGKFYNTPLVGLRIQARLSATSKASSEVKITLPFIRTIFAIFLVILGP